MTGSLDARAASFGPVAAAYARARPTFPDAALEFLVPRAAAQILDLGAGTGKLTTSLLARGLEVVAVDPSPPMLDELRQACPKAEVLVGAAEAIPLSDGAVDAVMVAQAWHWVDPSRAAPEIARVLRPGGTLGLVWNIRDKTVDWVARYERIVDFGEPPAFDGVPVVPLPFQGDGTATFRWEATFDEARLLDLASSRSAFQVQPEARRLAMLDALRALVDEIAGESRVLAMPYVTRCFRYRLA